MLGASSSGAGAGIGALLLIVIIFGFYFLPLIIAASRHVPNVGSVAVINIFLGWTFIGWIIALAMACRTAPPVHQVSVYAQPASQQVQWPQAHAPNPSYPPAGWHPDPIGRARLRYWDGGSWTDHIHD